MRRRFLLAALASPFMLTACIDGLFFKPDNHPYTDPARFGLTPRDIHFAAVDGSQLHGWWFAPASGPARASVVHVHGNAANISNHLPFVKWLPGEGFNLFTFDYRGFGKSQGKPTLNGVVADTRAAIAQARREAPGLPIVLLGQSMGAASAVRALVQEQADLKAGGGKDIVLLIADSPFSSYQRIAVEATRGSALGLFAPLAGMLLPGSSEDPLAAIGQLRGPVLFLHGERDAVIGIEHSVALHAAANQPKRLIRVAETEHIDALLRADVRSQVLAAVDAALRQ